MITRPFLLSALTVVALRATAQETPAPAAQQPAVAVMPMGTKPQDVAKELGLSEAQVEELFRIENEHGERMKQLNRQNLDTPTKRARVTELRDQRQAETQKLLTPEQWAKWQQMKQAQRDAAAKQREALKVKEAPVHQE